MSAILAGLVLVALLVIARVLTRPAVLNEVGGRALAFIGFFVLPLLISAGGTSEHLERAKTTEFCLSCHEMQAHGNSLMVENGDHLPAAHFQNRRIPRDQACYTCHTSYALFGDTGAKLKGLMHTWVHFVREEIPPEELTLYEPYQNRECLHCHEGARSFVENDMHVDLLTELYAGELSCLDCHGTIHDIANADDKPLWQPLAKPGSE